MNLAIDIGNTRIKTGLFEHDKLIEFKFFTSFGEFKAYLTSIEIQTFILSKVGKMDTTDLDWLKANYEGIILDANTPLPFQNLYESPQTLGLDRIAVVAAAASLFPKKNSLIIDAGTCITYDFIDAENNYHGGAISPGLKMRYKALHDYTAALPSLSYVEQNNLIGTTTTSSIHSGIMHGILGEIQYFRQLYVNKFKNVNLIITGGDGKYFESKIKEPIFAFPELVLVGLNRILLHNASI